MRKKINQLAKGITDSSVKTAETLDMLEKGQIRVRTDFAFEEKALDTVTRLAGFAVRALIIVAVLIGCGLLCTVTPIGTDKIAGAIAFRGVGIAGIIVGLFFAQRLIRDMKK